MNKAFVLLLALALLVGGFVAGRMLAPKEPPEKIFLPGETIRVEVVSQEALDKLAAAESANGVLVDENGVLRDKNTRLQAKINAYVRVRTDPAPSPEPEVVERIIRTPCGEDPKPLTFRAELDAWLWEGLEESGTVLSYGWSGNILCIGSDGVEEALLHSSPLNLSNTYSISSASPEPPRASQRWYAGTHVLLDSTRSDRWRLYAGRRWLPEKRFSVRTGLAGDSDAIAVDIGLDW